LSAWTAIDASKLPMVGSCFMQKRSLHCRSALHASTISMLTSSPPCAELPLAGQVAMNDHIDVVRCSKYPVQASSDCCQLQSQGHGPFRWPVANTSPGLDGRMPASTRPSPTAGFWMLAAAFTGASWPPVLAALRTLLHLLRLLVAPVLTSIANSGRN